MTEDEMVGWHHLFNGHEFYQTLGDGEGQGILVCCSSWSTRLEARFPYHGSGAMTRSPSPLAWRPDFPGAPREAH